MSWAVPTDIPRHTPLRPNLNPQHSSSLPSTPYQHPRDLPFASRSPSPHRGSSSPRSIHSENNHLLPSLRKQYSGCKYETGMAHFRRRMPYSLGSELLPEEQGPLKERLDRKAEGALTAEMKGLFETLLPSAESEQRRSKFVRKLENMLNNKWPGNDIKVNVFGSSGNKLCSSHSDVDICITTPFKELERVCILADFLAKNGMERVVCVSHAKVPIVKIWDPELELACDMNVNNTLALENTRMIKTYVDIDERVRPLAMIIKYWTKRRILNDAALGGTLSSYTWICLIINFLQTRSPPILPSLQQNHKQQKAADGTPATFFDDDLDKLKGFGRENKSTLGELLFQFFRYYGHEVDYETNVISVREGKLISKEGKGWHLLQNNRLCVEEPFNNSRNLGNTADDTSFRGLHMELRRAFATVSEGNLEECCAQYEYPPEEERNFERPPQQPRPIIAQTPPLSSRGGRGGGRGGRHANQYNRGNSGRRASSAANRPNNTRPANPSFAAEIALQAQQAQYMLHDHLYQQIQLLQAQEQELRMQLQNQSLISGRPAPTLIRQPYLHIPYAQPPQPETTSSSADENSRARAGTVNHPPLTSPVRQHVFYNPNFLPVAVPSYQGTNTNPPSPSMTSAVPDLRRNHRRSSASNTSPRGSLRAQSQPARPIPSTVLPNFNTVYPPAVTADGPSSFQSGSPKRTAGEGDVLLPNGVPILPKSPYVTESRPSEYVGYYVGEPTQPLTAHGSSIVSPLSVPGGLAIQNGGLPAFTHGSPEHISSSRGFSERLSNSLERHYAPSNVSSSLPQPLTRSKTQDDRGPLIVDGSLPRSDQRYSSRGNANDDFVPMSPSMSASEDRFYNTPGSVSDTMSQDMQEQFAYDDEYDLAYDRKAQDLQNHAQINGWKPARVNAPMVNGHLGRLETLSEQLQRFQMSGVHSPSDIYGKSGMNIREANSYFFPLDEHTRELERHERNGNATHTSYPASGHPPAKENKGNSNVKGQPNQPNGVNVEKPNNTNHRGKQKGRQDTHKPQSSTAQETDKKEKKADSQRKPNGISTPNGTSGYSTNHSPGPNAGGWQTTTKKKHKKGAKDTAEHNRSNNINGAEPLPADESLRKGG